MDRIKNFRYGICTNGPLPEHILTTRHRIKFYTSQSGPLLTSVVLFFHQQIKFVKSPPPSPVLVVVILERLHQTDHSHPTFVLYRFHFSEICRKIKFEVKNSILWEQGFEEQKTSSFKIQTQTNHTD